MTRLNNFRLRLLVGCEGLEQDASRFRTHRNPLASDHDTTCKLCHLEPECPAHFIGRCPLLSSTRRRLLSSPQFPAATTREHHSLVLVDYEGLAVSSALLQMLHSELDRFVAVVQGLEWYDDRAFQHRLISLLYYLHLERNRLIRSD